MSSGARGALAFLTPLGGAAAPSPAALAWFPVVGAAMGAVLGGLWWGAGRLWPPAVAAGLVVAADLALTGLLHLDGLADSADGLLPHATRERRLQIMRQPDVGAFGVGAAGAALLLRYAALSALRPSVLLLVAAWAASRAVMAVATVALPYARATGGGLASAFGGRATPAVAAGVVGLVLALGAAAAWRPLAGPVSLCAGVLGAAGVLALARRRLGGYTGDVLGAAGVVLETVTLVAAAARW